MPGIILNKNIEVVVASPGGVGSTLLLAEISKYKQTHQCLAIDYYKHLPLPPIALRKDVKFVYVFGDPVTSTISIFHRNFQHQQSVKLQRYATGRPFIIPKEMDLDAYAKNGIDGFGFNRHYDNWHDRYRYRPTFFMRYESMHQHLTELASFLSLPPEFVIEFPEKVERQSVKDSVDPATLKNLEAIYAPLEKWQKMPDWKIRSTGNRSALKQFLRKPYPQAFWHSHVELPFKVELLRLAPGLFNLVKKVKSLLS